MTAVIQLEACVRCRGAAYEDNGDVRCLTCGATLGWLPAPGPNARP